MKRCKRCGKNKQLTEFHINKTKKDGYRIICKQCVSNYEKQYYQKNKDYILKKHKKYNKEYYKRPEVKKQKAAFQREYYKRPGIREKRLKQLSEYNKKYYKSHKKNK